jgi:2-keto-4-pentenoate hydratase/2-oxohepta-3-ene-1,7-dioic acid hydratase in catechol pathway
MRVARFAGDRVGVIHGDRIEDATAWALERSAVRTDDAMIAFIHASAKEAPRAAGTHAARDAPLGPPLRQPGKIVAAAANYWKHTQEMNPGKDNLGGIREKGFFLKAPSSIIGPGGTIRMPFADRRTDQEAELAVIIGRAGKDIAPDCVLDHVFGYTCLLDITVRGKEDRGLRKSFDTFTPIGPWIVTRDDIPDPNGLRIACRVNGETRQDDTTRSMIMPVTELVAWISQVMTLQPGDIIATGTPAGVAPLAPGDRIEVEIEAIGVLAVDVAGP